MLLTLAFSIDDKLGQALTPDSPGLRYLLMDGVKGNKQQVDKINRTVKDIRAAINRKLSKVRMSAITTCERTFMQAPVILMHRCSACCFATLIFPHT